MEVFMKRKRKTRRTKGATRRTTARKGNSGTTKAERWSVPKGLVLIPKDAMRLINKSMKCLGDAVAYGAMASKLSVPGTKSGTRKGTRKTSRRI